MSISFLNENENRKYPFKTGNAGGYLDAVVDCNVTVSFVSYLPTYPTVKLNDITRSDSNWSFNFQLVGNIYLGAFSILVPHSAPYQSAWYAFKNESTFNEDGGIAACLIIADVSKITAQVCDAEIELRCVTVNPRLKPPTRISFYSAVKAKSLVPYYTWDPTRTDAENYEDAVKAAEIDSKTRTEEGHYIVNLNGDDALAEQAYENAYVGLGNAPSRNIEEGYNLSISYGSDTVRFDAARGLGRGEPEEACEPLNDLESVQGTIRSINGQRPDVSGNIYLSTDLDGSTKDSSTGSVELVPDPMNHKIRVVVKHPIDEVLCGAAIKPPPQEYKVEDNEIPEYGDGYTFTSASSNSSSSSLASPMDIGNEGAIAVKRKRLSAELERKVREYARRRGLSRSASRMGRKKPLTPQEEELEKLMNQDIHRITNAKELYVDDIPAWIPLYGL